MQNKTITAYKTRPHDPTAWEAYRKEHPEKNQSQALMGFILMTFGVMGCFIGGAYLFSNLDQLIMPLMLIGAIILVKRFK